ncbi:MAG: peptide deformylase [Chitinophagaceae bacterium]|nr:MAG: peptide deformylase [Chitinophagaceae bacterium]
MSVLPIVAYGDAVLRKTCKKIEKDYPDLDNLIQNMFDTMYHAEGVGLAAPQIGLSLRLFVIDTIQLVDEKDNESPNTGFKKVFINPEILEESGKEWAYEEGCLSIPKVREIVHRKEHIKIRYFDENFTEHTDEFTDIHARVIQHEYDHIEGILFTDHISVIKKRLLKGKLDKISKGKVKIHYRMRFPS